MDLYRIADPLPCRSRIYKNSNGVTSAIRAHFVGIGHSSCYLPVLLMRLYTRFEGALLIVRSYSLNEFIMQFNLIIFCFGFGALRSCFL
jgi:hypothetical protein